MKSSQLLKSGARLLPLALLLAACEQVNEPEPGPAAPGVVLLIGDGMGVGSLDAARARAGSLYMEGLPVHGLVRTASASDSITDSAAAATAYATGVRTYNGAIGVARDSAALTTTLERAESRGWATGLVATSSVTHATPAAFAAHVPDRGMQYEIARQIGESGVDALFGGGARYFLTGSRPDGEDLGARFVERGCAFAVGTAAPATAASTSADCAVNLFADDGMPPAPGREPRLADLALAALSFVESDPDGFFLMVEGSQIDWAGHANDCERSIAETLDFDAAVRALAEALEGRPNTLIVVTADHETGGLDWASEAGGGAGCTWTTGGHTAAPVPLFARGATAEAFLGEHDNDEVGRLIREFVENR